MKRTLVLRLAALAFIAFAILLPGRATADCDPTGTYFYKMDWPIANSWADGHPCGPAPEQNWCVSSPAPPPTTCCNGYHEQMDEPTDNCFYCQYEWYVCD
jgi:hypothetical protein